MQKLADTFRYFQTLSVTFRHFQTLSDSENSFKTQGTETRYPELFKVIWNSIKKTGNGSRLIEQHKDSQNQKLLELHHVSQESIN